MTIYEFDFRTGSITIDYDRCSDCRSYSCIKACSLFGAGILRVEKGKPVLLLNLEEAKRRCIEDMSCELYCWAYGNSGLKLYLDMLGLDEYRNRIGLK